MPLLCASNSVQTCTHTHTHTHTHIHTRTQAEAAAVQARKKEIERNAAIQASDDRRMAASTAERLLEERNLLEALRPDEPAAFLEDGCRLCGLSLSAPTQRAARSTIDASSSGSDILFNRAGEGAQVVEEVVNKNHEEGRSVVWCHTCGNWYHKACTGITYSPYVLTNDGNIGFSCQFCLDDKAGAPGFTTHLGSGPQSLAIITQVH